MIQGFDLNRTVQAIHYLVARLGKPTNYMKLVKLVYFADRYHLRHYGTLLTQDDYYAMRHGPVASATLNVLKEYEGFFFNLERTDKAYYQRYLAPEGDRMCTAGPCEYDELSKSDRKALDFVVEVFGKFNQWQLRDIAHDYPEWKKHKELLAQDRAKRVSMRLVDFLEDPQKGRNNAIARYLGGRDPFEEDPAVIESIKEHVSTRPC